MKKGISLIVLVITIIVMIILAASVVITLSNTGIINKANQAVDATDIGQVQDLAALVWADEYMSGLRGTTLINSVKNKLKEHNITEDNWNIVITDTGISIDKVNNNSSNNTLVSLGSQITVENYGDTIDYHVKVNNIIYDDWQIFYHNNEYVYLIASESVTENVGFFDEVTVSNLTTSERQVYEKFMLGNEGGYVLPNKVDSNTPTNQKGVIWLIKNYSNFANKTDFGNDVVGAIGGPTIELLAAGWNAKGYTPEITLSTDEYGYDVNLEIEMDGFYSKDDSYWVTSTGAGGEEYIMMMGNSYLVAEDAVGSSASIYPVVCIKSSILATKGVATDWSITGIASLEKKEIGSLITSEDYGKSVNYSVTVNKKVYNNWSLYYHTDEYVYIILSNYIPDVFSGAPISVSDLTTQEHELYNKFRLGLSNEYTLRDMIDDDELFNAATIANMIRDYSKFANVTDYGTNVVGAIGGPTIELLAAGYNSKNNATKLTYSASQYGYKINGGSEVSGLEVDGVYFLNENDNYWLTTPSSDGTRSRIFVAGKEGITTIDSDDTMCLRPVVCLKSNMMAVETNTSFLLVK